MLQKRRLRQTVNIFYYVQQARNQMEFCGFGESLNSTKSHCNVNLKTFVQSFAFSSYHDVSFFLFFVCVKMRLRTFQFQNFPE